MSDDARILVVDDVPQNVRLLEAVLAPRGFDVVSATDGDRALGLVESSKPDLVLLDVMMPEPDGYEVCRRRGLSRSRSARECSLCRSRRFGT